MVPDPAVPPEVEVVERLKGTGVSIWHRGPFKFEVWHDRQVSRGVWVHGCVATRRTFWGALRAGDKVVARAALATEQGGGR
jgi:hypothetical protein